MGIPIPIIGGLIEKFLGIGGNIVDQVVKDKDLAEKLKHEFRMAVQADDSEFRKAVLEADTRIFEAQQETIQAELHQSDLYTKRTRPKIAIRSFHAGLVYTLLSQIPEGGIMIFSWTLMPWQFQWSVLGLLYSPALTYMGVRSVDKWKNGHQ